MRPVLENDQDSAEDWRDLASVRLRRTRYRPKSRQGGHRHGEPGLSLVLSGSLEEESSREVHQAAAGSLVFKPAGCWHADHYGLSGAVVLQIAPRELAEECRVILFQHYRWIESTSLARVMLRLLDGRTTAADAECAFWDAMAGAHGRVAGAAPRWWSEARELLDDSLQHPTSVAAIARAVGVHPVYLARVCRRELGKSARAYLQERRTLAAWRACQRGSESLAVIAARSGFSDQAHMTRSFTRLLGISPARLRRLASPPE